MNNLFIAGAVAAPLIAGATVGGYKYYQTSQADNNRARIITVAAVTKMEKVAVPRQECWQEKVVKVKKKKTESESWKVGATALGAAIGGAIGNQVGHGRGNDAATVAGAAVGGKIGHDIYKDTHKPEKVEQVSYEQKCKTVNDYRTEEKPAGYDVTYEYQGKTYTTHMDEAPQGEYLPVETEVKLKAEAAS